jgi:sodium-dependent dicarboxylate transporter 2/3/5
MAAQKNLMQRVGLALGPALFVLINFPDLEPGNPAVTRMAAMAVLMATCTIVLFLGGIMIALTMEKWNLHRRIALRIIRTIGGGPSRIVLGFMVAAAFLSMWLSNTATAIMMVPIGLAIILEMEKDFGEGDTRPFSVGVMLGIAYACSIGGGSRRWSEHTPTSRWPESSRSRSPTRRPWYSANGW